MQANAAHILLLPLIALTAAALAPGAAAQQAIEGSSPATVEEVTVLGRREFLETEFTARREDSSVDSAKLMNRTPGGGAVSNGPLTGQIQYRGMFGPRINVRVNGMLIHGGGPNWMAPPLHHIPASLMDSLVVEQGIASIATGGGIGGAATAYWKKPQFGTGDGWDISGDTELSLASAHGGGAASAILGAASDNARVYLVGSLDKGGDYESAAGAVAATEFQRQVSGIGYDLGLGGHDFGVDWHQIQTDRTGTPSLPMDIDFFDTQVWNLAYSTELDGIGLSFRVFGSEIDHGMNNFLLRRPPTVNNGQAVRRRQNLTASDESGFKLTIDGTLAGGAAIVGLEGKRAEHSATVSDPDAPPFFANVFAAAETDSLSLFTQWSALVGSRWYLETGLRLERMQTDAGAVDAFPARLADMNPAMWPLGTPPRGMWLLRERFNGRDRAMTDTNVDWVAKARRQLGDQVVLELAAARKTRSPIYQERYMWLPTEATAGIADGNTYLGDPGLQPEVSHQIELGIDLSLGKAHVSPRFYLRRVSDYIQGIAITDPVAIAVSRNANGDPTPLQFANTEAEFAGFDVTFGYEMSESWQLNGIAAVVSGQRRDVDDDLYRVAPANLRLSLDYLRGDLTVKLEQLFVARQDKLSAANTLDLDNPNNSYAPTPGYSLSNLFVTWSASDRLTLSAGAENLWDKAYINHLSGFNRVPDSIVPRGSRMFEPGRNLFGRLQYRW